MCNATQPHRRVRRQVYKGPRSGFLHVFLIISPHHYKVTCLKVFLSLSRARRSLPFLKSHPQSILHFCRISKARTFLPQHPRPVLAMHFSTIALVSTFSALAAAVPLDTRAALPYTGDITHYTPGLGSCGVTNNDGQAIVALSVAMMKNGPNPNTNPICGKMISIFNPTTGTTTKAKVMDTCWACALEDVDLSPSLFKTVAPNGDGRVHGIQWGFDA